MEVKKISESFGWLLFLLLLLLSVVHAFKSWQKFVQCLWQRFVFFFGCLLFERSRLELEYNSEHIWHLIDVLLVPVSSFNIMTFLFVISVKLIILLDILVGCLCWDVNFDDGLFGKSKCSSHAWLMDQLIIKESRLL